MKILNKAKKLLTNSEALAMVSDDAAVDSKVLSSMRSFCSGSADPRRCIVLRRELAKFGLTEFEVVNLINVMPKGLVHLQNIIEEMVDRLTEDQMAEILRLLK